MLNKISSMLDAVADSLEKKGLIKEAFEIDKVADEIDKYSALPTTMDTKPPTGWVSLYTLMDDRNLSTDHPMYEDFFNHLLKTKKAIIITDPMRGTENDGDEYFSPMAIKDMEDRGIIPKPLFDNKEGDLSVTQLPGYELVRDGISRKIYKEYPVLKDVPNDTIITYFSDPSGHGTYFGIADPVTTKKIREIRKKLYKSTWHGL